MQALNHTLESPVSFRALDMQRILNTAARKAPSFAQRPIVQELRACASIHEAVEHQATRRPDSLAAACDGERLTYRELNAQRLG